MNVFADQLLFCLFQSKLSCFLYEIPEFPWPSIKLKFHIIKCLANVFLLLLQLLLLLLFFFTRFGRLYQPFQRLKNRISRISRISLAFYKAKISHYKMFGKRLLIVVVVAFFLQGLEGYINLSSD